MIDMLSLGIGVGWVDLAYAALIRSCGKVTQNEHHCLQTFKDI